MRSRGINDGFPKFNKVRGDAIKPYFTSGDEAQNQQPKQLNDMSRSTILPGVEARSYAYDKYLAQKYSSGSIQGEERSKGEMRDLPVCSSDTFLAAELGLTSLRVSIWKSDSSKRIALTEWPNCADASQAQVPSVIAFQDELPPIWGFSAVKHPQRIENLRALLEPGEHCKDLRDVAQRQLNAHSRGRGVSEVIGEFIWSILDYVHANNKIDERHCRYLFVTPGSWGNPEKGSFSKAIKSVMSLDSVSFLEDIEAGALLIGKKLLAQSKRRGILILIVEGKSPLSIF